DRGILRSARHRARAPCRQCRLMIVRPSTTSTFFPLSSSMRQKPTTGTNALGSAPTVSPARSTAVGGPAKPGRAGVTKPIADAKATLTLLPMLMVGLLFISLGFDRG